MTTEGFQEERINSQATVYLKILVDSFTTILDVELKTFSSHLCGGGVNHSGVQISSSLLKIHNSSISLGILRFTD
jgi:hypothetical protein